MSNPAIIGNHGISSARAELFFSVLNDEVLMSITFSREMLLRHARLATVLLVIGILYGLFVLGAQPIAVGLIPSPWDKLAHAATFAFLAAAMGIASGMRGWRVAVLAFAGALLVGALDELHQVYLPGRQAGWDDLSADAVGSLFGALIPVWLTRA